MKLIAFCVFVMSVSISFASNYPVAAEELLFYQNSSSKIGAMGKTSTVISDGVFSVFHNPASFSRFERFSVSLSSYGPFENDYDSSFEFAGLGFANNAFMSGIIAKRFKSDINNELSSYTGVIAFRTSRFLTLGVGGNLYEKKIKNVETEKVQTETALSLDLGFHSYVNRGANSRIRYRSGVGASLKNFYSQDLDGEKLPSIISGGFEIELIPVVSNPFSRTFWMLFVTITSDYQNDVNSKYSKVSAGIEKLLNEMLAIRFGYYRQQAEGSKNFIEAYTYGFGIQVPFYRMNTDRRIPFNIALNYSDLPNSNISGTEITPERNINYSLTLSWMRRRD